MTQAAKVLVLVFAMSAFAVQQSHAADIEPPKVKLVDKFKTVEAIATERAVSVGAITKRLDGMQVKTPDASFDTMINTWLPYQAYDAHFKARSGYY